MTLEVEAFNNKSLTFWKKIIYFKIIKIILFYASFTIYHFIAFLFRFYVPWWFQIYKQVKHILFKINKK